MPEIHQYHPALPTEASQLAHQSEAGRHTGERDHAVHEQLGGLALMTELTADVRAEDAGRVYDPVVAYTAAKHENMLFDAHTEALKENELFHAHVEALQENELFDAHVEALTEDKTRTQQKLTDQEHDLPTAAQKPEATPAAKATDYKKQAEIVLHQAGLSEELPIGSEITKDQRTGNLIIANNHNNDVRIVEPQTGKVTDYRFNKDTGILSVKSKGADAILTRVGSYVPNDLAEGQSPLPDMITLPAAVARSVGHKTAVAVRT